MLPLPSLMRAEISSMPETPLIASSIGSMTDDDISSGLAPGSDSATLTVAGSARGNRSTPRSRNEKIPSTTSDITSIVAKTGRRTQSSDSIGATPLAVALDRRPDHLRRRPSTSLSTSVIGDALAALTPLTISIRSPSRSPTFSSRDRQLVAVDDEHAVDAVAVLQRRVRQRQHVVDLAALDVDAGERAGLEQRRRRSAPAPRTGTRASRC